MITPEWRATSIHSKILESWCGREWSIRGATTLVSRDTMSAESEKTMRVGVHVVGDPAYGGVYQYELSILEALLDNSAYLSTRFSFVLSYLRGDCLPLERLQSSGWSIHTFPPAWM